MNSGYRIQLCCQTCKYVADRHDWNNVPQYFCNLFDDKPKISMIPAGKQRIALEMWESVRAVDACGTCDEYEPSNYIAVT